MEKDWRKLDGYRFGPWLRAPKILGSENFGDRTDGSINRQVENMSSESKRVTRPTIGTTNPRPDPSQVQGLHWFSTTLGSDISRNEPIGELVTRGIDMVFTDGVNGGSTEMGHLDKDIMKMPLGSREQKMKWKKAARAARPSSDTLSPSLASKRKEEYTTRN